MIFQHATTMLTELARGLLRLGLDRLGDRGGDTDAAAGGGLTVEACHPYGLRSRPRDPDVDSAGNAKGAGLLLIEMGGGDEGGIPTQDPRITSLPDEGKGGAQLYGWTGSAVSTIVIQGSDGAVVVTVPAGASVTVHGSPIVLDGSTQVGGAGGVPIARSPELQTWAGQVDAFIAATATAGASGLLGAPITLPAVTPLPATVAAQKGTVV